ncbi:MAG: LamG-like jellyroll fold domain-containing protein [Nitrospirota bacterium]
MKKYTGSGGTRTQEPGLVLHYAFENDFKDSGKWQMDGRWHSTAGTFTAGKSGNAIQLTGSQLVHVGSEDSYWATDEGKHGTWKYTQMKYNTTLEAWVYPTADTSEEVIFSQMWGYTNGGYSFNLKNINNALRAAFYMQADNNGGSQDGRAGVRGAYSSVAIPLNTWTHVAATFDTNGPDKNPADLSVGRIRIYVNGEDVTTSDSSGSLSQPGSGETSIFNYAENSPWNQGICYGGTWCACGLFIGGLESSKFFVGRIDEAKVWNVTKDASYFASQTGRPYIIMAEGSIGSDQLKVTFSEGVYTNTGSSGALVPSDFVLTDTDNGRTIVSVSHTPGSSIATLTLSSALDSTNDIGTDTLSAASNAIYDNENLSAPTVAVIITTGISEWKFDEGSGQTANDSKGTNHGTLGSTTGIDDNDPTWTTSGKVGNALSFGGTSDYVDIPEISGHSDFTLEAWVWIDSSDDGGQIINTRDGGIRISDPASGSFYINIFNDRNGGFTTNGQKYYTFTVAGITNRWAHIAMVGKSDNTAEFYVDGSPVNIGTQLSDTPSGDYQTGIGNLQTATGWSTYSWLHFKGKIDEVLVYNYALTAAEVLDRYIATSDTTPPSASALNPANGATSVPVNSDLTLTLTDGGSGVDWTTFDIVLSGNKGYSKHYTDLDTAIVTKTGSPASYNVTVNPDANFSTDETITVTVNASDLSGNALVPPAWSFTTVAVITPPAAPTIGTPQALSTTSIRWNFTDNASDEDGFKLHDLSHTVKASSATPNLSYLDEGGLSPNTQYTRHVHAYNAGGDSTGSADASRYTLSVTPNVTADKSTSTWYGTANVVFTNAAGFGAGGVQYYRYAWDQNATYIFNDTETQWTTGTLTKTATATGSWYLHVKSYDGDNVANGTADYGPYYYDGTAPSSSNLSPANGATNVAVNSNLTLTLSDANSGVDWTSFSITLSGNKGYSKTYTDLDTTIVTKTGTSASYDVTVNPDTDFGLSEVITVTVNVNDLVGNSLVAPTWSFTTSNLPTGAIAYWKLDEGSGQTAADSVGSNNGTLGSTTGADANDPTWTTAGKSGNALSFDGVNRYVDLPEVPLSEHLDFSLEAWVWIDSTDDGGEIFATRDGHIRYNGGQQFRLELYVDRDGGYDVNPNTNNSRYYTANTSVPLNTWVHLGMVVDASNNLQFYINGSLFASVPAASLTNDSPSNDYQSSFGNYQSASGFSTYSWLQFKGKIDEAVVYNRALTAAEVLERYNAGGL